MLDQIPQELLVQISGHLILQDKLRLITTCRHVFNAISNANLYSELDLLDYPKQAEDIIGMFINSRYSGIQVKLLAFDDTDTPDELLLQLPVTFPNVTRFKTQHCCSFWRNPKSGLFAEAGFQWSNTLETYNLNYDWNGILPVLKTTVFPKLTMLSLGDIHMQQDKKGGFDIPYFMPHIKNAPALRNLTLTSCGVDLDLLEHLHSSCPHLRSLKLTETHIIIKSNVSLPSITPANSLLDLELENALIFDKNGLLLDYITAKYRRLEKLALTFCQDYHASEFTEYFDVTDVELFTESEDEEGEESERRVYDQMDRAVKRNFERSLAVYKESGNKFFANISPNIRTLEIDKDVFGNTLQSLSRSKTQLFNMKYYNDLQTADQLRYISNLNSLKKLEITVKFPNGMDIPVIPSPSVDSLVFTNSGQPIDFGWLLSSFPSIVYLDLSGPYTWNKSDNDTRFSRLLKLCASVSSFDQKCFDFLVIHAPNIQVLDLSLSDADPITIDISGWELKEMSLILTEMLFDYYVYYKVNTSNAEEILKVDTVHKTVTLVGDDEPADAALPILCIKSTNDKRFMLLKCQLSLTQNQITVSYPN